MEKQKKSAGTVALVVLLLIVTIASLILATYAWAKYTSTDVGNATATVAKWNVTFTPNSNETFTRSYSHVASGKVAPGTSGSFEVTVVPNDTEVCFAYTIKVNGITFLDKDDNPLADTLEIGKYNDGETEVKITLAKVKEHIKLTYGTALENATTPITEETIIEGNYHLANGTHNGTTGTFSSNKQVIKWTWDYQDGTDAYDYIDTAAGKYANENDGLKFKIDYTMTATQIDPATEIN